MRSNITSKLKKKLNVVVPKASNCDICKKKFGFLKGSHHCKRCYRPICSDCTKISVHILNYIDDKKHKICLFCQEEVEYQIDLRQKQELRWNETSAVGKSWYESNANIAELAKSGDFNVYLQEAEKLLKEDPNIFAAIDADVLGGRTDKENFNYSLMEFLNYNQQYDTEEACRTHISNVLKAFCARNPKIGYSQGMNLIAAFLLNFFQQEKAFWMFTFIVEKILPSSFYQRVDNVPFFGFQVEKMIVTNLVFKKTSIVDPKDQQVLTTFIDRFMTYMMLPLLVDFLNVEALFKLWNEMIMKQNFNVILRATVVLLIFISTSIVETKNKKNTSIQTDINQIRRELWRGLTYEKISKREELLLITDKEIEEIRKDQLENFSKYYTAHEDLVNDFILKSVTFTQEQVELIQGAYEDILKQTKGKTGITQEEFVKLFKTLHGEKGLQMPTQNEKELDKVYALFDVNHDKNLEFGEFICCLLLLLNSDFDQKIIYSFRFYDRRNKKRLSKKKFRAFIDTICKMAEVLHKDNDAYFIKDMGTFKTSMLSKFKTSKVKLADLQNVILEDPFVRQMNQLLQTEDDGTEKIE